MQHTDFSSGPNSLDARVERATCQRCSDDCDVFEWIDAAVRGFRILFLVIENGVANAAMFHVPAGLP